MPKPKLLVDQLELLLNTGNGADVYFLVGEDEEKEQIAAHKTLLMAASDVFEAMFAYDSQNGTMAGNSPSNPVVVTDICAVPFNAMLRFIYTNNLSVLDGQNAMAVFYAAKKYAIIGLIEAFTDFPISKLPNVFLALAEARLLQENDFAGRCLAYIDNNMEKLIKSDDFLPIDQKLLLEILSREQLKVGEESAIWQAALRWADQQCHQNGIECSGDNRRQMLGQILMTIRFPLMAKEDFVKSVVPSQVLTDKEVISVLLFHSHSVATECGAFDQFPLQFSNQQRILTTARDSPSPKGRLLLKIQKFSHIILRIYGSRPFCSSLVKIMGFSWYLSSNLFGIQNGNDQLCFFLNCNSAFGVPEWSCSCSTTLRIVSQKDDKMDHFQTDRLFFQKNPKFMHDSGLLCKMPLRDLMSSENGWHDKEKDTLTVTVDVTVENAEIQPSIQKQK